MTEQFLDLSRIDFWLACIVAILALAPFTQEASRKWVWAGLNLSFVVLLLGWQALNVVLGVVAANLILRAVHGSRHRMAFSLLAGSCVGGLFLLHKLPQLSEQTGFGSVNTILSVMGFSYITLRMVEVLRAVFEDRHAPPDLPSMLNYLTPFHMLAAGPIQAYDDFVQQPDVSSPLTQEKVLHALERIASGLFKKFVLAYLLAQLFLTNFESTGLYFFLEMQVFFLWLFLDFSAYSDIAVGVGALMGVATPENFNRPYAARNVIDFWERWHISLSLFIRRNVFIPVQIALTRRTGGLNPLICASLAFAIAFVLCGLWHGLSVNFLLWGLIHAAGLIVVNLYRHVLKRRLSRARLRRYMSNRWIGVASRVATYEFVALSLVVLFYP